MCDVSHSFATAAEACSKLGLVIDVSQCLRTVHAMHDNHSPAGHVVKQLTQHLAFFSLQVGQGPFVPNNKKFILEPKKLHEFRVSIPAGLA